MKSILNKIQHDYDYACQAVEQEEQHVAELTKQLDTHKQAVEVTQVVAQAVQQAVHQKIAQVVTSCLEAIFDDPYQFHITFERKRNRTEAVLSFERNGVEVDPMSAAGGGAVDVAAFALRVACLTLRQDLEQVMVLDEPCKFLSRDLQPRLRPLLTELSDRLGIQFLVVTHMQTLRVGTVLDINPGKRG